MSAKTEQLVMCSTAFKQIFGLVSFFAFSIKYGWLFSFMAISSSVSVITFVDLLMGD